MLMMIERKEGEDLRIFRRLFNSEVLLYLSERGFYHFFVGGKLFNCNVRQEREKR